MKIVIAIDSFKGSLSSSEANKAVYEAAAALKHSAVCFSVADGGEGTVEALCKEQIKVKVTGPLNEKIEARYGIMNGTAVIEIAQAAGLPLVPIDKRNPLNTTSYGVGEIIKDAMVHGCRKFIVGIGGSATNDGGVGMLCALGYRFLDKYGNHIPLGAKGLEYLDRIDSSGVLQGISECEFMVACDVRNPLCGKDGCSKIFGPQKGASEKSVELMDKWLENYALMAKGDKDMPGAGAAGGLGFAFASFLGAKLESGIEIVLKEIGIDEQIKTADLVITGEGKLDMQSIYGKTPVGVARLAKKYGKRVIAFCGKCECENISGIDEIFEITPKDMPLSVAMETAYENLKNTAYRVLKGIRI